MNIEIDVSNSFGSLDLDNSGGIISYLDSWEWGEKNIILRLRGVVLNVSDNCVRKTFEGCFNKEISSDDAFCVVRSGVLEFLGCEAQETLVSIAGGGSRCAKLGREYKLGDRVYFASTRLGMNPACIINFAFLNPLSIKFRFSSADCFLENSYSNGFVRNFNASSMVPVTSGGAIFDADFLNEHCQEDWEGGCFVFLRI